MAGLDGPGLRSVACESRIRPRIYQLCVCVRVHRRTHVELGISHHLFLLFLLLDLLDLFLLFHLFLLPLLFHLCQQLFGSQA